MKRMPERLGNACNDQALDSRRFFLKSADQPARVHLPQVDVDRGNVHFAKAVERTFCVESITCASLAVPGFAQPIDPPGLEPVPEPQNEVVFVFLVAGARLPRTRRASAQARIASKSARSASDKRLTCAASPLEARSFGIELMVVFPECQERGGNRLTSWRLREAGSARTASNNSPSTRPATGPPAS